MDFLRNKAFGEKRKKKPQPVTAHLSELRSCVEVEVAVLGSPSLIVLMASVDVKQL